MYSKREKCVKTKNEVVNVLIITRSVFFDLLERFEITNTSCNTAVYERLPGTRGPIGPGGTDFTRISSSDNSPAVMLPRIDAVLRVLISQALTSKYANCTAADVGDWSCGNTRCLIHTRSSP